MYEDDQAIVGVESWKERTLVDLLHFRRLTKGDNPIFLFLGDGDNVTETLSANALHQQASLAAAHLARTLPPCAQVILLFENSLEYIIGFFACLYAGHVPISGVYPSAIGAIERFTFIAEESDACAVLGKRETLRLFHQGRASPAGLKWVPIESALQARTPIDPVPTGSDDLALIQYTSGSTDNPKGVCLSHLNICHNIHAQLVSFNYQNDDTGLNWLPFTHDMGLLGAVLPALAAGNPFYFMGPDKFIERPGRWLAAISRYGATIAGGPDFAFRFCTRLPESEIPRDLDLSRWGIAFNGSENINPETLDRFADRFSKHGFRREAFLPCYGLAENTVLVTSGCKGAGVRLVAFDRTMLGQGRAVPSQERDVETISVIASCGSAHHDQNVVIADPENGDFLPENHVGEIWVNSPSTSMGYLNNPARNAHSFIEKNGSRYLRTQDFGFFHAGELFHVGRLSEKFSYNGSVYYTNDIALSLGQALDGAISVVAPPALPERELPSVIIEQDDPNSIAQARQIMTQVMKSYRIERFSFYFIRKGYIVRTPSGKIRSALTLDNILKEQSAILASGDTHAPVATGVTHII